MAGRTLSNGEPFHASLELAAAGAYVAVVLTAALGLFAKARRSSGEGVAPGAPATLALAFVFEGLAFTVGALAEQLYYRSAPDSEGSPVFMAVQVLLLCIDGGFLWATVLQLPLLARCAAWAKQPQVQLPKVCSLLGLAVGLLCAAAFLGGQTGPGMLLFFLFFEPTLWLLVACAAQLWLGSKAAEAKSAARGFFCAVVAVEVVHFYQVSFAVAPLARHSYSMALKNLLNCMATASLAYTLLQVSELSAVPTAGGETAKRKDAWTTDVEQEQGGKGS